MITLPASIAAVVGAEVQLCMFETDQEPPDCEKCPEHPALPGVVAVVWEPISAAGGYLQVCTRCASAAIETAFSDSAATALTSRAVRVHIELWVATRPALCAA